MPGVTQAAPASPLKAGLRAWGRGMGGRRESPQEGGTGRLPELGMCLGQGPVLWGGVGHGVGHRDPGAVASSPVCPADDREDSSADPWWGGGSLQPQGRSHPAGPAHFTSSGSAQEHVASACPPPPVPASLALLPSPSIPPVPETLGPLVPLQGLRDPPGATS